MICDKCKGRGIVDNNHYYNMPVWKAYEDGIPSTVKCSKCNGFGYISTTPEAINDLKVLANNTRGYTGNELKRIVKLITE